MLKSPACVQNHKPQLSPSRSQHTSTLRSTRVHLVVIVPIFSLISPSSRHLIVVAAPVRPSRTHRRLHPIRYHVPLLACKLLPLFQCTRAPKFHYCIGERLRDLYSTFGASGCTLACAKAADVVNGRAGLAMVGGAVYSWLVLAGMVGTCPS